MPKMSFRHVGDVEERGAVFSFRLQLRFRESGGVPILAMRLMVLFRLTTQHFLGHDTSMTVT